VNLAAVAVAISAQAGLHLAPRPAAPVGGGSIHACHRWACSGGQEASLFVKVAPASDLSLLEGEADGLARLAAARAVQVPELRAQGVAGETAFLALTWIERGSASPVSERLLGEQLAAQHRCTARRFGLDRDNHIGRTPQQNGWMDSWPEFFRERRLRPQLVLAVENGLSGLEVPGQLLMEAMPALLTHAPPPSLLHGDLWGGNWLADAGGAPVIFDPAVYHGDREADLAMTRLFGGFGPDFYAAYEEAWPLPTGKAVRTHLYNLYHVLNHANLFGGGYVQQALATMERLLAQVRG
jgi:fructosamine-3-kinase